MFEIFDESGKLLMRTEDKERANRCYWEWPHAAMLTWRWSGMEILERKKEPGIATFEPQAEVSSEDSRSY